ncbi:hypothetical protein TeGR_g5883 [Tetraparma gracilis]|uniref:Fumarylacetoacetase-like C-terminal domain-containing protein n=1 Tax=Tetraparma gracilis TaxID=2962635 RepID=A0ABQ6MG29_9STRA|nr:hypothetical protein TeGR_g5883 [Tetraparma gracilis]
MGGSGRDAPFSFHKPACAAVDLARGGEVPMARGGRYDFEVELTLLLGRGDGSVLSSAEPEEARGFVRGVGVGCDLTLRDRQAGFKERRQPWDDSKALEFSAPVSAIELNGSGGEEGEWWFGEDAVLRLKYEGEVRQEARVRSMIWHPLETIAFLSQTHDLKDGDLVMMGTPAGVGPVEAGGTVEMSLEGGGRKLEAAFKMVE